MSKLFYFDCSSGISGDMTVAALLDLGADRQALKRMIDSIQDGSFEVQISRVKKAGLDACDFDVKLDAAHENHDHDMEWLYGEKKTHSDGHAQEEHVHDGGHVHGKHGDVHEGGHMHGENEHVHDGGHIHGEHVHDHGHDHTHAHEHRSYHDVLAVIDRADMTDRARSLAVRIFTILGEAEAKAHGTTLDEVHFHEVGAIDSIVDVLSVAVCADSLGMEQAIIPWLREGEGCVRCQHGLMPIPVPAVTAVVQQHGLVLKTSGVQGELVTPTGAAIAACFMSGQKLPDSYRILRYGLGAGKREYELPGILRIMEIETEDEENGAEAESVHEATGRMREQTEKSADVATVRQTADYVVKLESDIDDCSGETLGYCMEQLLQAGAREAHYIPVFMKKNRPAYQLEVLCDADKIEGMEDIIFRETTTIGIRRTNMERTIQSRELKTLDTPWGTVRIKICTHKERKKCYPEYEDVAAICRTQKLPFDEIFSHIKELAVQMYGK